VQEKLAGYDAPNFSLAS